MRSSSFFFPQTRSLSRSHLRHQSHKDCTTLFLRDASKRPIKCWGTSKKNYDSERVNQEVCFHRNFIEKPLEIEEQLSFEVSPSLLWGFPVGTIVKNLPVDAGDLQEMRFISLGREDPLEKEMSTHSSTLAWKIPWAKEPCKLQSTGSPRD